MSVFVLATRLGIHYNILKIYLTKRVNLFCHIFFLITKQSEHEQNPPPLPKISPKSTFHGNLYTTAPKHATFLGWHIKDKCHKHFNFNKKYTSKNSLIVNGKKSFNVLQQI